MTPPLNELAPASSGKTQLSLRAMERVIAAAIASVPGTAAVDAKLAGLAGRAFPRIMAQMDPDARATKRTKFGSIKHVYDADLMKTLRRFFEAEVARAMPAARILYWT